MPSHIQIVNALLDEGKLDQAAAVARRALAAKPSDPDLLAVLGFIAFARHEYGHAEFYSRRLHAVFPDHPGVNANLGAALLALGRTREALGALTAAVRADPRDVTARAGLGEALTALARPVEARGVIEEGLASSPDDPGLLQALAGAVHACGRVEEGLRILEGLVARGEREMRLLHRFAAMHTYAPSSSRESVFNAHRLLGSAVDPGPPHRGAGRALPDRPLRVGLLSPDFRRHSVASVTEPFIEHADRRRVVLTCYSTTPSEDEVTRRIAGLADRWRAVGGVDDAALCARIRSDGIDVLIDLAGLSQGTRLGVLAGRCAPLVMTYAGYPNTTGIAAVTARLVDSLTDPAGSEAFSTEALVRLDPCSVVYAPPPRVPIAPAISTDPITFASFNSVLKLNQPLIELWATILRQVPGSRLLLKHTTLAEPSLREELRGRFEACGAPAASVEVRPPDTGADEHLRAYAEVDIALDTFPYNGTVTTLEALSAGVPVVTRVGNATASRMGLTILSSVGLADLCTDSDEGYITAAVGLARDVERRRQLRSALGERLRQSPLCDGPGFARRMEQAIAHAWTTLAT